MVNLTCPPNLRHNTIHTESGAIEGREVDMENEERSSRQAKHSTHKETEDDIELVGSG